MSIDNGVNIPDAETQEMLRAFVSEAFDSLDNTEPIVEDLRQEENSESVNAIFRVFHTLKGLSGFFEMLVINKVTHEAETLLDIMRKQNKKQSEDVITVIYQSFDFLRELLQRVNMDFTDISGKEESESMILIIKDVLDKVVNQNTLISLEEKHKSVYLEIPTNDTEMENLIKISLENESTNQINIEDNSIDLDSIISDDMLDQYITNSNELLDTTEKNLLELEKDPNKSHLVRESFGAVHSLKGNSGFMGFAEIEEICFDMETILDSVRNNELDIDQNLVSILLSNIETVRKRIDAIGEKTSKLSEHSHDKESTNEKSNQEIKKNIDPILHKEDIVEKPILEIVNLDSPTSKSTTPQKKESSISASSKVPQMQRKDIRVETNKIDKLFDMVGELITIESMVTRNPDIQGLNLPNFAKSASMLNKITRELQEISMSIRMMPLEGLFNKMKRLVRDVSIKMHKKVDLRVLGQETEMDKNVIDEISDPLVHILRNAIDHGVEMPEERLANGKTETGIVKLSAKYEGNEILIVVEDDGKGIDRDVIAKKAEEKGLLRIPSDQMTDREIFALIFEPGFSTAKVVTDISGRGVGMDVVKKNIEKLRGKVTIDSKKGKGSVFTLRIPLTLAIMEAMLTRVGDSKYALPLLTVRESFRPTKEMINVTMDGLEVVKIRNEILPIIRLHQLFHRQPDSIELDKGILIITESGDKTSCLFVDEIVGQQQAVIKNLSDYIGKVPGLTGCMILGDGSIGLILDIDSIIEMSETEVELVITNK